MGLLTPLQSLIIIWLTKNDQPLMFRIQPKKIYNKIILSTVRSPNFSNKLLPPTYRMYEFYSLSWYT